MYIKNRFSSQMISFRLFRLFFFSLFFLAYGLRASNEFNFVTSCDDEHFPWIAEHISSIKAHHPSDTVTIFVYNLGLTASQIQYLAAIPNVFVKTILPANPDICKKFIVRKNGRLARGWYSWKPVIMHQALEELPYFLYMDSGMRVKKNMQPLFDLIQRDGYVFVDCAHTVSPMTTGRVKTLFDLNSPERKHILDKMGLSAGFQGISRKIKTSYIDPVFALAHDLFYFEDDGSAPWGFGGFRHDQTLFSIQAHILGYKIHTRSELIDNADNKSTIVSFFAFKSMCDNPLATKHRLC